MIVVLTGGFSGEQQSAFTSARDIFCLLQTMGVRTRLDVVEGSGFFKNVDPGFLEAAAGRERGGPLRSSCPVGVLRQYSYTLDPSDVVLPVAHGPYVEDGCLAEVLGLVGTTLIGCSPPASRRLYNKAALRDEISKLGLLRPESVVVHKEEFQNCDGRTWERFLDATSANRFIVKPIVGGSSVGISVVDAADEQGVISSLKMAMELCDSAIIEEFIEGQREFCVTVATLYGHRVVSACEVNYDGEFFNQSIKKMGSWSVSEIKDGYVKGRILRDIDLLCSCVGPSGIVRFDVLESQHGGLYIIECDTLPGLSRNSICFRSFELDGLTYRDFISLLIGEFESDFRV